MAKFTIINFGLWDVPRNEIIQAETPEIYAENRRYTISGFCVLIQDQKLGNVLWDTGISSEWQNWPEQYKKDYTIRQLDTLEYKLNTLNLTADDIDLVICSHLHYDHAGNIRLFRNKKAGEKILISEQEAQEAFVKTAISTDGISGAYFRDELVMKGIGYQTISKNVWLSDDLFLFIQEGHTPGVIGLLIKTEQNGNFIFTSDAVYSSLNFGPPIVLPGLCVNPTAYKKNIDYLQQMQQTYQAQIIFSHDVEDLKKWNLSPYYYE